LRSARHFIFNWIALVELLSDAKTLICGSRAVNEKSGKSLHILPGVACMFGRGCQLTSQLHTGVGQHWQLVDINIY
jgi:hypothetical protein